MRYPGMLPNILSFEKLRTEGINSFDLILTVDKFIWLKSYLLQNMEAI